MNAPEGPVLVGTDLSARSDRAIDRAFQLAGGWNTRLVVVHAMEAASPLVDDTALADRTIRAVLPEPDSAIVDMLPAIGPAPSTISAAARSSGSRLVVTGVARMNHVGDYFVGTAVDHMVRTADVPVLVVKQRAHQRYRAMLVATDCSDCSRHALLQAAKMFPDIPIHVVYAFHVPYEGWLKSEETRADITRTAEAEVNAFLDDANIPDDIGRRITTHVDYGEVHRVVIAAAGRLGTDLVVLGTHGRSGFIRSVIGSRAEELLRAVPVDTLMVRAGR